MATPLKLIFFGPIALLDNVIGLIEWKVEGWCKPDFLHFWLTIFGLDAMIKRNRKRNTKGRLTAETERILRG